MPRTDASSLLPLSFRRSLDDARDFEKLAFQDIRQYVSNDDADFKNAKLTARWLGADIINDSALISVFFLIPYDGGGAGPYGYRIYIAMPQRLFGADVDEYVFGGDVILSRNGEAFILTGSSSGSQFPDLLTLDQGHVSSIFAFQDDETQYKPVYTSLGSTADKRMVDGRLAAGYPDTSSRAGTLVRWRLFKDASDVERGLAEWIVQEVFPERHNINRIGATRVTRQRLFHGVDRLQHLFVIEAAYADYPTFYIVDSSGSGGRSLIGDNIIARPLLHIHGDWILDGAKVLSSVLDGDWVGYVYDGKAYHLNRPSFEGAVEAAPQKADQS